MNRALEPGYLLVRRFQDFIIAFGDHGWGVDIVPPEQEIHYSLPFRLTFSNVAIELGMRFPLASMIAGVVTKYCEAATASNPKIIMPEILNSMPPQTGSGGIGRLAERTLRMLKVSKPRSELQSQKATVTPANRSAS